jgi:hypothetical protein
MPLALLATGACIVAGLAFVEPCVADRQRDPYSVVDEIIARMGIGP